MDPQAIVELFRKTVTEHYFDMNGRVNRSDFWYFIMASFVVSIAAGIVSSIIGLGGALSALVGLALLPPTTGMGARRLQDIGRDGNLVWALTIPIAIFDVVNLLTGLAGPFGIYGFLAFYFTIGWLINLWALIALVAMVYFWVQPGNAGANQYGAEPKAAIAPPAQAGSSPT
jgi:uncharacterized membrane protein YhaH (DUF805 family)